MDNPGRERINFFLNLCINLVGLSLIMGIVSIFFLGMASFALFGKELAADSVSLRIFILAGAVILAVIGPLVGEGI
jgi:hypothetical protein